MSFVFVSIDLAKNVFPVHGVNEAGKPSLVKPSVARGKLMPVLAMLPPSSRPWPFSFFSPSNA